MSYVIGQYNHNRNSEDDRTFIDLITSGTARRRDSRSDSGTGTTSALFQDECLQVGNLFPSEYYYFRCYIKRLSTQQTFYIKLVNYDDTEVESVEQYIKTITVQGGNPDEWVSVEFIFHPIVQFDTVLFQLQRTLDDYRSGTRYPIIAYQELGIVKDLISLKIGNQVNLLKIGVQSHPGLMMCINGEEIHASRSGIYELKNGTISVNFFSVVNAAKEEGNEMQTWMEGVNAQSILIEEEVEAGIITREQASEMYKNILSTCFIGTSKIIEIDPFTLDYMYEE